MTLAKKRFYLELYTDANLVDRRLFDDLWGLLADPLPKANRWGPYERTTEAFTPDPKAPHRIFSTTRSVFVSGGASQFLAQLERVAPSLYTFSMWLGLAALDRERSRDRWLAWIYRWIETAPCLFGFGADPDEFDAKHVEETEDHYKAFGVSTSELPDFLPGIYWMTVFGSVLTKALPISKLEGAPGLVIKSLLPHQAVVLLDEPAKPRDLEQRLAHEREIAKRLGDDHFFDRARPDRALRAIPAFRSAMEATKAGDW